MSLGPGPFVRGLEYAADTKAIVVGKPMKEFFQAALDGDDPCSAVMIGDVSNGKKRLLLNKFLFYVKFVF